VADRGSHARHDRFAIAAALGGDKVPPTIGTCPACGALYADLAVLRDALRRAWTPVRIRDLRLSPADEARLRRPWWRELLASIGSARDTATKPLAIGFTALGLVGVLLTTAPILPMGSAAAPLTEAGSGATMAQGSEAAAPSAAGAPSIHAASSPAPRDATGQGRADASKGAGTRERTSLPDRSTGTFLLSVGFLTLGLGLFGLRRSARKDAVR
jgi:hypothetical protein